MTTAMGPPPPIAKASAESETLDDSPTETTPHSSTEMKPPMGTPPPKNPSPPPPPTENPNPSPNSNEKPDDDDEAAPPPPMKETETAKERSQGVVAAVPYTIPEWSGAPRHQFQLEVLKDGGIVDQLNVYEKGAYMFGRVELCDFMLQHQTISRFHAVLQFKTSGEAYIYDLGSTHGTFVNKKQVSKKVYVDLHVGDVIRFGHSSRLYIFQGPSELMPPEKDLKAFREYKMREEILDQQASLQRARLEASLAEGISWGMGEDAIMEEAEDDGEEVTWQTYKGQLTEKQIKTRDKITKRMEKIAHMKKEIDAIRAKDISQGGLTQGQQTQIARNEQRTEQILEELENLEETLNESIRESLGARLGKPSHRKKKGMIEEEEEELLSDDDEFYDRTKKPSSKKAGENPSVETADTLLDKRDAITKEMEDKKELLSIEKKRLASESAEEPDAGDALDAFMTGLSTKLVLDKTQQLQKELSDLQSEYDRVAFLLKIADPTGEAAKKRASKESMVLPENPEASVAPIKKQPPLEQKETCPPENSKSSSIMEVASKDATVASSKKLESGEVAIDATEVKADAYTVTKPQWLGATVDKKIEENHPEATPTNENESEVFVDYKDRNKILEGDVEPGIENAAPGLIIRKRKQVPESKASEDSHQQSTSSSTVAGLGLVAEDAVALLLRHNKGYHALEDEESSESQDTTVVKRKKSKKPKKRVLGPERPSFLDADSTEEAWVPPEGQSGDGRTSLNDRYGY